jgi:hypothetical protein
MYDYEKETNSLFFAANASYKDFDIEPEDFEQERPVGATATWTDPLEFLDRSESSAYSALGLRLRGILLAKRFAWSCLALFIAALVSLGPVDKSRHPIAQQTETKTE